MEQNTHSNQHPLILTCLSGCAFSLLYKWSIAEYGWDLHIGFQLFASVMSGTILQYLPVSLRIKHFLLVILSILGMVQNVEPLVLGIWIGSHLDTVQNGVVKTNRRNITLILFTMSMGLTYVLLEHFTPPFLMCTLFVIVPSILFGNRHTIPPNHFGSIPQLIHGAILGVLFIALWNQQSPYTHPQSEHLLFAGLALLGANGILHALISWNLFNTYVLYRRLGWCALFIWPFIGYASVQE